MSTIQLINFTGILPRYSDTNLQPNQATVANNVKLMSGEIRPWKKPVLAMSSVPTGTKTIFKLEGTTDIWLTFTDDTDICYSPLADQSGSRIYYSEGGVCKKTTYAMATSGTTGPYPRNWYYMGTPAPTETPTATSVTTPTGPEDKESVVYVFTYVSEFDGIEEETAPSPASDIVDGSYSNYNVNVVFNRDLGNNPISPVVPTNHLNITKLRVYRAVTGSESVIYMEVDELPLNATTHQLDAVGVSLNGVAWTNYTYPDTVPSTGLIKELDSIYYTPPPANLKGLVSMPNGFLAGFVANEVWFSEPFCPHAWPSTYMLTTDSPIVGLGVYGNTLVVCTERQPYTVSGTHPESLSQEKQPMFQPCASKRSIAYDQYGVVYASPYGLVALAGGQMDVFTRPIITKDEWAEFNPSTMVAAMHNNLYMCSYMKGANPGILIFSRGDEPALVTYDLGTRAMHVERSTGKLYCLDDKDNSIYELDGDLVNSEVFEWWSKRFYNTYATSYSAIKVDADYTANDRKLQWDRDVASAEGYDATMGIVRAGKSKFCTLNSTPINQATCAANRAQAYTFVDPNTGATVAATAVVTTAVNGSVMKTIPPRVDSVYVNVAGYADGKIVFDKTFEKNDAIRLPPDRGHFWQFRVTGNYNVRSIVLGTTMREVSSPV